MPTSQVPQAFIHGTKLLRKATNDKTLSAAVAAYQTWKNESLAITTRDQAAIERLVDSLNRYKETVEPTYDSRPNSAQEVLQPSILEEFFEYLFCTADAETKCNLLRRPAAGYLDLVFNPKSLRALVAGPEFTIRKKDHDFVLGSSIALSIKGETTLKSEDVVIPAVAIECKRYLERNMLDECSGTAERIKRATPYCLYLVVAEYLKMDDCNPELSRVDEIYILRRQRNLERLSPTFVPNPIYPDLVWEIYQKVMGHLARIWWDPDSALKSGKLFNLPAS
jgi:hypothetical protein